MFSSPVAGRNLVPDSSVRIVSMRVVSRGIEGGDIQYGDDLEFVVVIESEKDYGSVVGRLSFVRKDLQVVATSDSTVDHAVLDIGTGTSEIRVSVPGILLSPASYVVSFTLTPEGDFANILWEFPMEIRIEGGFFCGAPYHIAAAWLIDR